jgi:hypothetical protein
VNLRQLRHVRVDPALACILVHDVELEDAHHVHGSASIRSSQQTRGSTAGGQTTPSISKAGASAETLAIPESESLQRSRSRTRSGTNSSLSRPRSSAPAKSAKHER